MSGRQTRSPVEQWSAKVATVAEWIGHRFARSEPRRSDLRLAPRSGSRLGQAGRVCRTARLGGSLHPVGIG